MSGNFGAKIHQSFKVSLFHCAVEDSSNQESRNLDEMSSVVEDDNFVISGLQPQKPIPDVSLGKIIYESLTSSSGENEALVDGISGRRLTFRDILQQTCTLAAALIRQGCRKDTVISVCSENNLEFCIPVIAALYIGAVVAPINHTYVHAEMEHAFNISKPKIVFCSKEASKKIIELKPKLEFLKAIVVIDSQETIHPDVETMKSFIIRNIRTTNLRKFSTVELDSHNQVAFILCSSGTTGLPKGVMITHENNVARMMQATDDRIVVNRENNTGIAVLPFYHAFGLFICITNIIVQKRLIILSRFDGKAFLRAIEKYKISFLALVPPLVLFLAKSPLVDQYDLSSVEEIGCGAAPLSKDIEDLVKRRLNLKIIRQAYGLTETTLGVIVMPSENSKSGSSGKIVPYMKAKVRDPETGKSMGPHQVGELCFKGPLVMKGYYLNDKATKDAFTSDGWLLTGDLGYYDEEEFFFIVDRLKELIKYKGYQVPPAELEAILLTHPKIKDAGVIGVPNEEAGELPLAFIVTAPDVALTESEVENFVAERVSSPKRLRGGVIFIGEIPKSASGKILRRELKQLLVKKKLKL